MRLKIKNKEKKERKVGAAISRSQIESSLLSCFTPLPTIWKPRGFFFLPYISPTAEAVTMLCWERVGAKYTVAVCITRSLDRAWVRLNSPKSEDGIPTRPPPSPQLAGPPNVNFGEFPYPRMLRTTHCLISPSYGDQVCPFFSPFLFFLPCISDTWPRR